MKTVLKTILIATLVVGAVGATVIGIAYAQDGDPHPQEGLAELMGLTKEELQEKLQSGQTIQELADEAGVDLEAYHQEMEANREERIRTWIEESLANHEITQDQADWLLEGLEKGYLQGGIFRFGGQEGYQSTLDGDGRAVRRDGKPSSAQE